MVVATMMYLIFSLKWGGYWGKHRLMFDTTKITIQLVIEVFKNEIRLFNSLFCMWHLNDELNHNLNIFLNSLFRYIQNDTLFSKILIWIF